MSENNKLQLTPIFENLEMALKEWWKNLKKFILVYLWGMLFSLVALAIVAIFFGLDWWLGDRSNIVLHTVTLLVAIGGFLAAFYFYLRAYISIFLLVKKNYIGEELEIFKESGKYFWSYLSLALLTVILVLLWSLLLIIPGIIYSVFYSLAVYIFFFEDKKGWAAIRRSTSLVEGYWWPVFGRFVVLGLLVWVLMMFISWPLSLVEEHSAFFQIWNLVVQVVSFLVGPIIMLYTYNIYKNLVQIKK